MEVEGITLKEGSAEYEEIGEIGYRYYSLSPLMKKVPEAPKPKPPVIMENPVRVETVVNATVKNIYYVCSDFNLKAKLSNEMRKACR